MSVLYLGYYHPRYLNVLCEWAAVLRRCGCTVVERYPNRYYKESIVRELGQRHEVITYFGHGRPGAWSAYRGITIEDWRQGHRLAQNRIVLSFSCYSLDSMNGCGLGQALLSGSLAECVLGYRGRVTYEDNLRCFMRVMGAISATKARDYGSVVKAIVGHDILPAQVLMRERD